jgi:riboflavin synthase
MFTGLVETMGEVRALAPEGGGARLTLTASLDANAVQIGDSIAVNGACLTVVAGPEDQLSFQLAPETLRRTNLGKLRAGDRVNLERALRVGDRLGGHWVQGHIDGLGALTRRVADADWELFEFTAPSELLRYMVPKGSIAVDGVSLTLVKVNAGGFSVALIPHTLELTTLGRLRPGSTVNLEVDLLAKYVEKLLPVNR